MAQFDGSIYVGRTIDEQLEQLKQLRAASAESDELVGTILSFQVADGYAYYEVTGTDPLTIVHLDVLDGYAVHPALIKGLDEDDVREQKEYDRRLLSLFAGKE